MPLILDNVTFSYRGGPKVLEGVSLEIAEGEIVAVTGPSGSGKSTLLHLIGGLLTPTGGSIVGRPDAREIHTVFQTPTVLDRRSVLDNILLGLHSRGHDPRRAHAIALRAASSVGLQELINREAASLSGGELQRTQVARTLVGAPALILADEPTGQLDRANTESVIAAFVAAKGSRSTVVIATHDPLVASMSDRSIGILDGDIDPKGL